jgi:FkbM family methyltransferase
MLIHQHVKGKIATVRRRLTLTESERLFKRYAATKRFTPTLIEFRGLGFQTPDALSVLYQLNEVFIKEKLKFSPARADAVIYDCGANVGVVTRYFTEALPSARIVSFEADQAIVPYFKKNLAAARGVTLVEKAVWTGDQGMPFGSEGADCGSIFYPENRATVPSVRLRDRLGEERFVDLLKMDIEGAEVAVLKDCRSELSKVERLFVEYHAWKGRPEELDEILAILKEAGFRYALKDVMSVAHPFIDVAGGNMDLQANIYAHRLTN